MSLYTNGFLNLLFGTVYICCFTLSLQLQQLPPVNSSLDCQPGVENDICNNHTQSPPPPMPQSPAVSPALSTSLIYGPSVVVASSSDYYAYSFYYYLLLLILLMLAIISVQWAIRRRQAIARTLAQQRSEVRQTNATISVITAGQMNDSTESSNNFTRKDSDLPPAYDEAIRMNTNLQIQQRQEEGAEEEGAVDGTTTMVTMSSVTIATKMEDNKASADDLSRTTPQTTTTSLITVMNQPSVFATSPSNNHVNNSNDNNNIV